MTEVVVPPPEPLWRLVATAGAPLPAPGRAGDVAGARLLWLEPGHWLAVGALDPAAVRGTAIDVSGAFERRRLVGAGWRERLMAGGWFDAGNTEFGPGCVARSVMHDVPVLLDCIDAQRCDIWVPRSFAAWFFDQWSA